MISLEEYNTKMKNKYKSQLKVIDDKLLSADSWSRGEMLFELLEESNPVPIPEELKYYIFADWWTNIDSYHDKFDAEHIQDWLKAANIDMYQEIKKNLILDDDGYIRVYRGIHEFNEGWYGLSWTTDKEVAIKFANGCGIRHQTKQPEILIGKVFYENVLGIFNNRKESEVLCYLVDCQDHVEKLYKTRTIKENNESEENN